MRPDLQEVSVGGADAFDSESAQECLEIEFLLLADVLLNHFLFFFLIFIFPTIIVFLTCRVVYSS